MYFLLLLFEFTYEQPRKLRLSATAKIDFLSSSVSVAPLSGIY